MDSSPWAVFDLKSRSVLPVVVVQAAPVWRPGPQSALK
jgi:hypothetical protein